MINFLLSSLTWDPDRNFFVIPYINHPVTWYGLFFALGFLVGYFLMRKIFVRFLTEPTKSLSEIKLGAVQLTDRLTVLVVLGTIIGARLGHVFFYGWPYYKTHPFDIFKIWEGGLASHGGAIGVLIALGIYVLWCRKDYPRLTFLTVLDGIVVPAALVGGCIRIGNFMNQEITGIPTDLPWGVSFMRPMDGVPGVPVHPVQLYESAIYFIVFFILLFLWRRRGVGTGFLSGWFFLLVFGSRFFIEFLKVRNSALLSSEAFFSMGQLLSIPFIILGIALLIYSRYKHGKR